MLSWFGGNNVEKAEMDASTFVDQPDTPAHVFAARAFRYSLFGTPKPSDSAPQKETAEDEEKHIEIGQASMMSPSKPNGILLTPGTTNLRRSKTVTFGAQVGDKEARKVTRRSQTGLPNTFPGKFPSPWTSKVENQSQKSDDGTARSQNRLNKALEDARNFTSSEPTKKPNNVGNQSGAQDGEVHTADEGLWQQRYEDYAERTQREMKKLIAKQRAAKNYARDKDSKAISLAEKLRQEQKKVQRLEAQVAELNERLQKMGHKQTGMQGNQQAQVMPDRTQVRDDNFDGKSRPQAASPSKRPLPVDMDDIWGDALLSSPTMAKSASKMTGSAPRPTTTNGAKIAAIKPSTSPLRPRDTNATPDKLKSLTFSTPTYPQRPTQAHQKTTPTPKSGRASARKQTRVLVDESEDMLDLPEPSSLLAEDRASGRRSTGQAQSKKFDALPSSPFLSSPPQYDRMVPVASTPSPTRKKSVSQMGEEVAVAMKGTGCMGKENANTGVVIVGKKAIDGERAAAARARIEARRMKRGGLA